MLSIYLTHFVISGPHHGHYVAIVKSRHRWFLFDDDTVTPVDDSELQKYFGDTPGVGSGYVLFYQSVDLKASTSAGPDSRSTPQNVSESSLNDSHSDTSRRSERRPFAPLPLSPVVSTQPVAPVSPASTSPSASDNGRLPPPDHAPTHPVAPAPAPAQSSSLPTPSSFLSSLRPSTASGVPASVSSSSNKPRPVSVVPGSVLSNSNNRPTPASGVLGSLSSCSSKPMLASSSLPLGPAAVASPTKPTTTSRRISLSNGFDRKEGGGASGGWMASLMGRKDKDKNKGAASVNDSAAATTTMTMMTTTASKVAVLKAPKEGEAEEMHIALKPPAVVAEPDGGSRPLSRVSDPSLPLQAPASAPVPPSPQKATANHVSATQPDLAVLADSDAASSTTSCSVPPASVGVGTGVSSRRASRASLDRLPPKSASAVLHKTPPKPVISAALIQPPPTPPQPPLTHFPRQQQQQLSSPPPPPHSPQPQPQPPLSPQSPPPIPSVRQEESSTSPRVVLQKTSRFSLRRKSRPSSSGATLGTPPPPPLSASAYYGANNGSNSSATPTAPAIPPVPSIPRPSSAHGGWTSSTTNTRTTTPNNGVGSVGGGLGRVRDGIGYTFETIASSSVPAAGTRATKKEEKKHAREEEKRRAREAKAREKEERKRTKQKRSVSISAV
jgi:hypothetical protein